MQVLITIFYCIIIYWILVLPLHFAGLNKKKTDTVKIIRIGTLMFGWTVIGWLVALYLAFTPNPEE